MAINGNDLFVASYHSGTIGEYSLSGALVNASLITGLNGPGDLVIAGGDLFVLNSANGTVGEYDTSGAVINASLITDLTSPVGMAASGNSLFVLDERGTKIAEFSTLGATINSSLVTGVGAFELAASGDRLFLSTYGASIFGQPTHGFVSEYTTSGDAVSDPLIAGLGAPYAMVVVPEPAGGLLACSAAAIFVAGVSLRRRRRSKT